VFTTPDRGSVLRLASELAEKWREKGYPKMAERMEEHIEESLSCLAFPEGYRRMIRTTNGLERLNQEIKRRTRVARVFPNRQARLPIDGGLAVEQSEEWITTGRRYLDIPELEEHRRQEGDAMASYRRDRAWRKQEKFQDLTLPGVLLTKVSLRLWLDARNVIKSLRG
jgi:putative transposase